MEQNFNLSRWEKGSLVWRYLRPVSWFFVGALVCAFCSMIFNSLTPRIVQLTVDSILGTEEELPRFLKTWLAEHKTLDALWMAAAAVAAMALLRGLFSFGQRVCLAYGSEGFVKRIRDALFDHIQHLDFQWHTENSTGDTIQRCTSDVDVIRSFVCNQLMEVIRTVFLITLYLSIMASMNAALTWISAIFVPIVGFSSGLFYKKIASRFQAADEAEAELTTCAQENLTGVRVVQAFGREQFEIEKYEEKNRRFSNLWLQLGKLMSVYWASGTFLTSLQVMVVILAGSVLAVRGEITLGQFLAFVSYNSTMAWPVRSLGRVLSEMSKAGVSMDRVGYILKAPREEDAPLARPMDRTGDIVFDHVSFGYGELPVLRDVSFTIPQGSTFAILGGTGSGKSTLVHLLDRLYDPDEGTITIGGIDIRTMQRESLRRKIGLILQEPFLFSKTIGENISLTQPDVPEHLLRRAAKIACVDDAIREFPDGYDTLVGERGVTLSGGQKQRVAMARMLMMQSPIMIFDDSLSAVDAQTDASIRAALRENLSSTTTILISHRITTMMQADQILVLDQGRVAELGTHAQLIAKPGIYKDIYDIQMSRDDRCLIEKGGEEP